MGRTALQPERAIHNEAGVEQRLGERSRLRLEFYNRQDRDLLFRSWAEPRPLDGRVFEGLVTAGIRNRLRGYARGRQILLERRSANGFTGWVSYVFGRARLHDPATGLWFDADQDQRHTVNIFGDRRIRPTVHLSMKWVYASGFPVPGFLREATRGKDSIYYLAITPGGGYIRSGSGAAAVKAAGGGIWAPGCWKRTETSFETPGSCMVTP